MENVLACITPQTNSRRLIDRAVQEADLLKGELHILNIRKGDTVFYSENSAELLEELFSYGSKKGGIVHALAGEDIPEMIMDFTKKNSISRIIVGRPPKEALTANRRSIIEKLTKELKELKIIIVERDGDA